MEDLVEPTWVVYFPGLRAGENLLYLYSISEEMVAFWAGKWKSNAIVMESS